MTRQPETEGKKKPSMFYTLVVVGALGGGARIPEAREGNGGKAGTGRGGEEMPEWVET